MVADRAGMVPQDGPGQHWVIMGIRGDNKPSLWAQEAGCFPLHLPVPPPPARCAPQEVKAADPTLREGLPKVWVQE